MSINWNYEASLLPQLGTVGELIGAGAKLEIPEANLMHEDKLVQVIVTNKSGKKQDFYCSVSLSKPVRSKEVKLRNLPSFPVVENTTKDKRTGEDVVINKITMPSNGKMIGIDFNKIEAEEWKPVEISHEDLVAL